jgi:predicted cobalt transporter CbtA
LEGHFEQFEGTVGVLEHLPIAVHAWTAAAGKGGRVKRKKAPAAAAAVADADQQQQQGDSADAAQGREMDVMTVGAADETPDTWARLLAGLAEICTGIGMALQNELCE